MTIGLHITEEVKQRKREAVESLYWHRVNIYQNTTYEEEDSGIEITDFKLIIEDEPCRVSSQITDPTSNSPKEFFKRISVILRPELDIPPGCRFDIEFNGRKESFKQAGDSRKYSDHQTIELMVTGMEEDYA